MIRQRISIVGIGMGTAKTITKGVADILDKAELVIGARRVIETYEEIYNSNAKTVIEYSPEKVIDIIRDSDEAEIAILMSGDSGFYSGTKKLLEQLEVYIKQTENKEISIHVEAGISSIAYFASRIHMSWEDAKIISIHGKEANYIPAILRNKKTFILTEGNVEDICRNLVEVGLGKAKAYIGSRLSYADEDIWIGNVEDYNSSNNNSLAVIMIVNEAVLRTATTGIEEDIFVRGKVPMTKSEVRAVVMSKLAINSEDVIYDIGAGTGSVSIEMAMATERGKVYAVECNPEGVNLIEENSKRFGCNNIDVIEGMAPEVIKDLPAPDVVFIGGSKGNLADILRVVIDKSNRVRVVICAVTMETMWEAFKCMETMGFTNVDASQINVSKINPVGDYHMFKAENPIFVIAGDYGEESHGRT